MTVVITGLATMAYGAPAGATSPSLGAGTAFSPSLVTSTPSQPWVVAPMTLTGAFPLGGSTAVGQVTLSSMSFYWWDGCPLSTTTGTPVCPVAPTFSGSLVTGGTLAGTCSGAFEEDPSGVFDFAVPLTCQGTVGTQTAVAFTLDIQLDSTSIYGGPLAGIYSASAG